MEKSKVVFITGASSGFGLSIARHLACKGYIVVGTSRKGCIGEDGVLMLPMDVTQPDTIREAVKRVIADYGRIDVLINNAGVGISGALELATEEEIRWQMDTNFTGTVRVIQEVLPHMRSRRDGLIINISSIGGLMGLPFQGFYAASKFAVEGFSEALSIEVKPFGIRVVLVEPGDFKTGFTASRQLSQATSEHAAYRDAFDATMKKIEQDEQGGLPPELLARKVEKIIESRTPGFRYLVGKLEQRFSVLLKKFIPSGWFQSILADYYRVK